MQLHKLARPEVAKPVQGTDFWRPPDCEGITLHRGVTASHRYPRHWHDELHLCAYTSGAGYLGHRGNSYRIIRNALVLMPAGEVHENWVPSGGSCNFVGIYLDAGLLSREAEQITGRKNVGQELSLTIFSDQALRDCLVQIDDALRNGRDQLQKDSLLMELVRLLIKRCLPGSREVPSGWEHRAVRQVRGFINENFAGQISLQNLAAIADLSPFHLHRVFSRETGMPPHAYQTQVRVNRAKELLRLRHSLSDIAAATGFADQSHLTRHFRRLVGVTPGRWADR